jgi:tripartite-type tricarboxylate transporter receptor subunit TctC
MMNRRHLLGLSAGLLAAPSVLRAQGAAWPARGSIRLIAQFPPGGLVDTVSRLIAPLMSQALNQTVVVENRAGNAGIIGTDAVAKSAPDGYTLLVSHASVHVFAAATRPTLPFDPVGDFTHLAMLVEAPHVILVRADSPMQTLAQLIETARRQPVRYGSSGIGSAPHLLGAMLSAQTGIQNFDHIPYAGSAPAMQDLLARNIESMIDPITTNVQQMRDGSLRALAVSTPQRLPAFPNVPTFAELGFPGLTSAQWLGLSAPRGLPAPIAERLTALVPGMVTRPDLMERFTQIQTLPRDPLPTGDAFVALMRQQLTEWTAVARAANISLS